MNEMTQETPLIFVTVGMDHHPFHRLVRWIDAWHEGRDDVRCLVQYGASEAPSRCAGQQFLSYQDLEATLAKAAVVICHAGGGTPMMCRWLGKRPVLVPRRHELGEHVDDHQIVFARALAQQGHAFVPDDERAFRDILDGILRGENAAVLSEAETPAIGTAARFVTLVDDLLTSRPPRRRSARAEARSSR
jgi:UDP-N-acetylglucosamine transferase subunit ALG13